MGLISRKLYLNKKLSFRRSGTFGTGFDSIYYANKNSYLQIPITHKFEDVGIYDTYEEPEVEFFRISDVIKENIPIDSIKTVSEPLEPIEIEWDDVDTSSGGSDNVINYCNDENSPSYLELTQETNDDGILCGVLRSGTNDDTSFEGFVNETFYCPSDRFQFNPGGDFCRNSDFEEECYDSDGNTKDCSDDGNDDTYNEPEKNESVDYDSPTPLNPERIYDTLTESCKVKYGPCSRPLEEYDVLRNLRTDYYNTYTNLEISGNYNNEQNKYFGIATQIIQRPTGRTYRYHTWCYTQDTAYQMRAETNSERLCHGSPGGWTRCDDLVDSVTVNSVVQSSPDITLKKCPD